MSERALTHPLAFVVMDLAAKGSMIDVPTVAEALSGASYFHGPGAKKGGAAYRVVAADVLGVMADVGLLTMHGSWQSTSRPEDGGAFFTVVKAPAAPGVSR